MTDQSTKVLGDFDRQQQQQDFFAKLKVNLNSILNLPSLVEQGRTSKDENVANKLKEKKKEQEKNELQEMQNTFQYVDKVSTFDNSTGMPRKRYMNLFSVDRGSCICASCSMYRGCFNMEGFRGADIFQCLSCGCPMNSHIRVPPERSFSNLLCKFIGRRYIKPEHYEFSGITAIFFVDRQKAQNFSIDVETLVSVLNEGSYNVFSFYEMDLVDLQRIWVQKRLYSLRSVIAKEQFEEYLNYLERFLELLDMCSDDDHYGLRKRLSNPAEMPKLDFFMDLLEQVNQQLLRYQNENQLALVFLLTGRRNDNFGDFRKLLEGGKDYLPKELKYFYSSKSKYHALRDSLLFFPNFFRLNINSFIITSNSQARKVNDTFKDLLDFNNFSVIKEDFANLEKIKEAFKTMPDCERFLDDHVNLKIVCKVGLQSLTILSREMPNFYRISSEEQNQQISDHLCPDLFNSQRIIVVYRPIVVKSRMEEVLSMIWKINQFVMVKRVYRRFSNEEAQFMASIEGIHPDNLGAYLAMMTEGFSMICLLTRPGAYINSKSLIVGCETGLRVRKSKILTDLSIDYQMKSGGSFKEKLEMNFYNVFESYTQQNIFRSMRDLFNLEELVLQENIGQFSKNIFINDEDDHIFVSKNNEVKQTNISPEVRKQIVKDLARENFNFFVYATQNELTTEQLISLYLPDCSQVQQVYLIIKPFYNLQQYIEPIKNLLQRLNYFIIDSKEIQLSQIQAQHIIQMISPFSIPPVELNQLTQQYQNQIVIMSIAKPGGRFEIQQFLRHFNFNLPNNPQIPKLVSEVPQFLIPCLDVESFRFIAHLFNPFLDRFDGSLFVNEFEEHHLLPRYDEKLYVINYMLMAAVGVKLNEERGFEIMDFYGIKESPYVHLRVNSIQHGQFEIRVRKFYKSTLHEMNFHSIRGEHQLLSWYYAKVNIHLKQRCPIIYQYRILHEERAFQGEFDQVFDCQEYSGRIFLLEVFHQIFQFGNDVFNKIRDRVKESKSNSYETNPSNLAHVSRLLEARSRVIAYFWGAKLAKFTKELELIKPDEFSNGYGPIVAKEQGFECKYKLNSDENKGMNQIESNRFKCIIDRISKYVGDKIDLDPSFNEIVENLGGSMFKRESQQIILNQKRSYNRIDPNVRSTIEHQMRKYYEIIFGKDGKQSSPVLEYLYDQKNLRLIPHMELSNLRILLDKEYIQQGNAGTGFWMDWNYERNEQNRQDRYKQPLNNFVLVHALPQVQSRFRLTANIYFMLLVELRKQKQHEHFLTLDVLVEDPVIKAAAEEYEQDLKGSRQGSLGFYHWFKDRFVLDKEKVIEALIKGFESSYFIEEEVIQHMQSIHKENIKKRNLLPNPLQLELFLFSLEKLNEYLDTIDEISNHQVKIEKMLFQKYQLMEKWLDSPLQSSELKQEEENLKLEMQHLDHRRTKVDGFIRSVFEFIMGDDFQKRFYFNSQEMELQFNQIKQREEHFNINFFIDQVQNNLIRMDSLDAEEEMQNQLLNYYAGKAERNFAKEFIPSKLYFLPLETGNNDKEWGKLDQEQIDSKMKYIQEEKTEKVLEDLEQFREAPFLKGRQKDDIQKTWVESIKYTKIGRFVDTRPDTKKMGIYVDKVKKIDQNLDDKIDNVIQKFMRDKIHNFQQK